MADVRGGPEAASNSHVGRQHEAPSVLNCDEIHDHAVYVSNRLCALLTAHLELQLMDPGYQSHGQEPLGR